MKAVKSVCLCAVALVCLAATPTHAATINVINVNLTAGNSDDNLNGTSWSSTIAPFQYTGSTWNDVGRGPVYPTTASGANSPGK